MNDDIKPLIKLRPNSKDLTPQRVDVLRELVVFFEENDYPPTMRELCCRLNLRSPSTVHAHLECLERQALVSRNANAFRRWSPTRAGERLGLQNRAA